MLLDPLMYDSWALNLEMQSCKRCEKRVSTLPRHRKKAPEEGGWTNSVVGNASLGDEGLPSDRSEPRVELGELQQKRHGDLLVQESKRQQSLGYELREQRCPWCSSTECPIHPSRGTGGRQTRACPFRPPNP